MMRGELIEKKKRALSFQSGNSLYGIEYCFRQRMQVCVSGKKKKNKLESREEIKGVCGCVCAHIVALTRTSGTEAGG